VLAIASKQLPDLGFLEAVKDGQEDLESGLTFEGLVLLSNPLNPESAAVVEALHKAEMAVCMVTGDHIKTAITVAYQCRLLHDSKPTVMITMDQRKTSSMATHQQLSFMSVFPHANEPLSTADKIVRGPASWVSGLVGRVTGNRQAAGTPFSSSSCAVTAPVSVPAPSGPSETKSGRSSSGGGTRAAGKERVMDGPTAFRLVAEGAAHCAITGPALLHLIEGVKQAPGSSAAGVLGMSFSGEAGSKSQMSTRGWLKVVISKAAVYARMTPSDKQLLMELLGPGEQVDEKAGDVGIPGLGR
jgi:magnesium-transporting ATPase (P-type)